MSEKIMLKEYIRLSAPECLNYNGVNYWREGRAKRVGVMVSTGPGKFGFSLISPYEDLDEKEAVIRQIIVKGKPKEVSHLKRKWSSEAIWERGTFIALERAMGDAPNPEIVPKFAQTAITKFQDRMKRYYK